MVEMAPLRGVRQVKERTMPKKPKAGAESGASGDASCLPARSLKSSTRIIASNMASLK